MTLSYDEETSSAAFLDPTSCLIKQNAQSAFAMRLRSRTRHRAGDTVGVTSELELGNLEPKLC